VTLDAVLAHATAQSSSLIPQLVGRYPARTPIKDKEWPGIIEKALRAVQDSRALQGYDVVPSMLTDQYDLIGWLQVLHLTCSFSNPKTSFLFLKYHCYFRNLNSGMPGDSTHVFLLGRFLSARPLSFQSFVRIVSHHLTSQSLVLHFHYDPLLQ
jgi:hypothetical protein